MLHEWSNGHRRLNLRAGLCLENIEIINETLFRKLYKSLGLAGDIKAETDGLLMANDIDTREYSSAALSSLPVLIDSEGVACGWKITEKEYETRRDFRDELVISIDPKTARDLDDALHVKRMSDGTWEVGVHIADVSHFVNFGTELDVWAAQRATSVYLVHMVCLNFVQVRLRVAIRPKLKD